MRYSVVVRNLNLIELGKNGGRNWRKKGFEDLFAALLEEYKLELQTVLDVIAKQNQRRDGKLKDWIAPKLMNVKRYLRR